MARMKIIGLFCLSLLLNLTTVFSQSDTLFWFAVPYVQQIGIQNDLPYRFHFVNPSADTVSVLLDVPANTAISPLSLQLLPASTSFIDVSALTANLVNQQVNIVQNKGVRIRSNRKVQAYYEVGSGTCSCNQEIFNLKGDHALGNVFYATFQDRLHSDSSLSITPHASIDIVAEENGTVVTVVSPVNLFGVSANVPVTFTLNAGQTYSVRSLDWRRENKPNGVKISANKRIAVTIKDEQVRVGNCGDLTGDQILPTTSLKSQYPLLKGNMQGADVVTVLAVHDRTRIAFEGGTQPSILLNAGEYRSFLASVAVQTILANKPIAVVQYSGVGCNVGMSVLPGLSCLQDSVYEITRVTNDPLIFNFVLPVAYQDSLRVNGGPPGFVVPGSLFNPLPGTNILFWWSILELNSNIVWAGMPVRISAPVGFSLGIRHGNPSLGMRFAHFGDFKGEPLFEIHADTAICEGDTVEIRVEYSHNASAKWTLPNGLVVMQDTISIQGFTAANSGWYVLEMIEDNCVKRSDSVYLEVGPSLAEISIFPPSRDSICEGDTLILRSQMIAGTQLQWFDQSGTIAGANSDSLVVSNSGNYYAIAYTTCGLPDTTAVLEIYVELEMPLSFQLSDTILCPGSEIVLLHSTLLSTGNVFLLQPDGTTIDISGVDSIFLQQPGRYALWYQGQSCTFDTSYFDLYPANYPSGLQYDKLMLCGEEDATLWTTGAAMAYFWYKDGSQILGATDSVFRVSETGFYHLAVIPAAPCSPDTLWLDTVYVYKALVVADFTASPSSGNVPLNVDFTRLNAGGQQIQWFMDGVFLHGDSIWQYLFERPGRFEVSLVVRDTFAMCADSASTVVVANDNSAVLMPTAFSPNNDGTNDFYLPFVYNADLIDWSIYNRWGELIFISTSIGNGWDGKRGAELCEAGSYVCVIRYQPQFGEMRINSSHFFLIR